MTIRTFGSSLAHVSARSGVVRLVGSGEIYTDASSLKFGSVEVVDTFLGFLGAGHSDESKATGSFSLRRGHLSVLRTAGQLKGT